MSLSLYKKKRNFLQTPEPAESAKEAWQSRFVVQKHNATRLHYDFRLELAGVLKSWAVPKGPSMNPTEKRLAVMVEDHPVSYIHFEGVIPKGNYGAGTVKVWDKGNFMPINEKSEPVSEKQALKNLKDGELKILVNGKKIKGEFVLVRLKNDDKNWLLIKHRDEYAKDEISEKPAKKKVARKSSIKKKT
jgi:bifunctional non-homologous end joining protein LigD